jgi:single-strand DNA-binding protein
MGKGVNRCFLLGHVGRDPEIKTTQGGMTIAEFSIAISERKKQGEEWVDHTEWVNCVAFQRTAEIVRDYVHKGSQLHIEGKLQTQSWDDKDSGKKRYKTQVIINELSLLGGPKDGASGQPAQASNGGGYGTRPSTDDADQGIADSDCPFISAFGSR